MKINLSQAVKYFFANPSLELVFIEAVANSIDAEATEINIKISIQALSKPETLKIYITDNGVGFTDDRFEKFSKLMEVEESSHKGIGRLVFLSYFTSVEVSSKFESKHRTFKYNNDFDEKQSKITKTKENINETILSFSEYYLTKIGKHDYLKPSYLRGKLLEEFYPKLYTMKQEGKNLKITISLYVAEPDNRNDFLSETQEISINQIEELKIEPVEADLLAMFQNMEIHYSIKKREFEKTIITALCIDGRTYKMDIISDESIPLGYEIIFLLYSSFFDGKVNPSRQELTIDEPTKKTVKKIFQTRITEILQREIPEIVENKQKAEEYLTNTFPHLLGYFEEDSIGFVKREDSIKKAQDKFFKDQREVLEGNGLSEEVYEKSLELSSRSLTEYILYRQIIIGKIKSIDKNNSEAELHNLIVPKRNKFHKSNFMSDLYSNNIWLLDDKYMTYNTILSEMEMKSVIEEITNGEVKDDDDSRPDITIVFSGNPETTEKVDVVIVELKKRNLPLADNRKVEIQLEQRARKLLKFYPNKIQRIWFYGIVEFNVELKLSLYSSGYAPLFSIDSLFYKETEVMLDLETKNKIPVGIFLLSMDSFINDADVRNSTFLTILKENFKNESIKNVSSIEDDENLPF